MTTATGDPFTRHRDLLFSVAYEITGSAADAEDVVQDTYLRWAADDREDVEHPRAYLVRIATRLALNAIRSRTRRREDYVGPWLPEPLLTSPDIAEDAVLSESVSLAMMLVLESLSPDERAVFVLREVFGFAHREIAEAVGRSEPAVRQIAHRAGQAVRARRPRYRPDPEQAGAVVEKFWSALGGGDLDGLLSVLAPGVVVTSDGGGIVSAARRPVSGADRAARFLLGLQDRVDGASEIEFALLNGLPGVLIRIDGVLDTAGILEIADGVVQHVYLLRNPEKLAVVRPARLVR